MTDAVTRRADGAVYYSARDGARWRIHDCTFGTGKLTRCTAVPATNATHRVFVEANGLKKCHRFPPGGSRELRSELLDAQFSGAGYLPTQRFDPSQRGPR